MLKTGDQVTCVTNYQFENTLSEGGTYIVERNQTVASDLVKILGIPFYVSSQRFVLKLPNEQPDITEHNKPLEIIKMFVQEYSKEPAEDEYDAGYYQALLDVLDKAFGIKVIQTFEFVESV